MLDVAVVGALLLGFRLEGTLMESSIFGVVTEVALNWLSLVAAEVLTKTVSVTIVLVSVELGASVSMSGDSVSGVMVGVSKCVGRNGLSLV